MVESQAPLSFFLEAAKAQKIRVSESMQQEDFPSVLPLGTSPSAFPCSRAWTLSLWLGSLHPEAHPQS
jgi:hypothetical protein